MWYCVFCGISLGIQFHLYRGWHTHQFAFGGARRWAIELGAITVDAVTVY